MTIVIRSILRAFCGDFLLRLSPNCWRGSWNAVKVNKYFSSLIHCAGKIGCSAHRCEELTHWKRLWCWERLGAGGEGDDRGWDGWMTSPTRWMWVWVNSRSWWWTGRPGVLQFMGSQRVGHDWATELNWISAELLKASIICCLSHLGTTLTKSMIHL